MLKFILNTKDIVTGMSPGITMLDFIRYHQQLTGTKIGCREGDCGACTILVGEFIAGKLQYSSVTSCLMPLANAQGKHIVTVEGLNLDGLNAVQQAFSDEGATQCGFCTPGFIVSLAGYCMHNGQPAKEAAIDAMNGNICRCTGYKSIERAAGKVVDLLQLRNGTEAIKFAVDNNIIPDYFNGIQERLSLLNEIPVVHVSPGPGARFLGGGTDLYVQQHDSIVNENVNYLFGKSALKGIAEKDGVCSMGASVTVADMASSPILQKHFPGLGGMIKLVSSTQIRNMATVAGNFSNASPIGDLTIIFLALKSRIRLNNGNGTRELLLMDFYKGYKSLNKTPEEFIDKISFELPGNDCLFNFEKVCKRTHLDIASVNTAVMLRLAGGKVIDAGISAGGVGPVPLFLGRSSEYIIGKQIDENLVREVLSMVQEEINPISDARGTASYKRLLLAQLIKAHFIKMFPALPVDKILHH